MFKVVFRFLVFILLSASFYYLGTLNLHKSLFANKPQPNPKTAITPTVTPYPTINPFNSLTEVEDGVKYSDKTYGISFIFPQNFSLSGTRCNLSLERFTEVPHSPMWNYIHIAIVSKNKSDTCDWIGHSGQDEKYKKLEAMDIGQTLTTSDSIPEYSKYTRLPDEVINKNAYQHFVSYKVWESSENTIEHIYKMDNDQYALWIMGLTNEDPSQPDSIQFATLRRIISSLNTQ